jgi:hypothetical protein
VADADSMPIGKMWNEALIVKDIVEKQQRTEAILLRAAAASIMTKEGGKLFDTLIKGMGNG